MTPADVDRVFGRGRLKMVTGEHVEVFREEALPGERRRYTKRFLCTTEGDFRHWTEREWRILARLVGHGIGPVPDVVQFDRGAAGRPALVQTYDAGVTVDHWATLLPVERGGRVLRHVFEDCAHWWALAQHGLAALDTIHELQLVHLDLKADNVCIPVAPIDFDPHAADQVLHPQFAQIALIDFAFSLIAGDSLATALPIGHQADYAYQSPRLLRALEAGRHGDLTPTRQLDWRCDLFSLAAMLQRYLPAPGSGAAGGWTHARHTDARALVERLLAAHHGPALVRRPHRDLITFAEGALRDADLAASLAQGWHLAGAAEVPRAQTPTPVTQIVWPVKPHAEGDGDGSLRRAERRRNLWWTAGAVLAGAISVPYLAEAWLAVAEAGAARAAPAQVATVAAAVEDDVVEAPAPAGAAAVSAPAESAATEPSAPEMAAPAASAPAPAPAPVVAAAATRPSVRAPAPALTPKKRTTASKPAMTARIASAAPKPAATPPKAATASMARLLATPRGAGALMPRTAATTPVAATVQATPVAAAVAVAAAAPAVPASAAAPVVPVVPATPVTAVALPPAPQLPQDFGARASALIADHLPQLSQRAERLVLRVLHAAARMEDDEQDAEVFDAARAVRLAPGDALGSVARAGGDARRLGEAASAAFWNARDPRQALELQLRAFGADPQDAEVAGNLAYYLLKQRPAQAEAARRMALYALALSGAQFPTGRVEDWTTLAVASALVGRERDARNALFVTLALAPEVARQCRAVSAAYAQHGEPLRAPAEAMLARLRSWGRSDESPFCRWPPSRSVGVRAP